MPSIIDRLLFNYGSNSLRIAIARKWGIKIGNDCYINPPCTFPEPYLISIGNHCTLAGNNHFVTHDGAIRLFQNTEHFKDIHTLVGPIAIRDNCFIGFGATVLYNVEIGSNCVIGTGSVVTKSVPPNSVFAGNPARFICSFEEFAEKCKKKSTGNVPRSQRRKVFRDMFKNFLDRS